MVADAVRLRQCIRRLPALSGIGGGKSGRGERPLMVADAVRLRQCIRRLPALSGIGGGNMLCGGNIMVLMIGEDRGGINDGHTIITSEEPAL